jgi:competence protein ComEC
LRKVHLPLGVLVTVSIVPRPLEQNDMQRSTVKRISRCSENWNLTEWRLQPPLAPLRPSSYDFGRDMYFAGIGASGFAMGAIKTVEQPPAGGGLSLRYAAFMQGLRDAIDARIRATLDGDRRAIATALLTGRRDAISGPVNDAMFISGLGHVLSISGYHMAVVAGVAFFAVRALLALIPALTVSFPIIT